MHWQLIRQPKEVLDSVFKVEYFMLQWWVAEHHDETGTPTEA
jgi:hypothetical protein